MNENKTERFYNQKTMTITAVTVGAAAYLLGVNKGTKRGYIVGLTDGIKQGLGEGRLEGYVNAMSDVATIMKNMQD